MERLEQPTELMKTIFADVSDVKSQKGKVMASHSKEWIDNMIETIDEKPQDECYCGNDIRFGDYLCKECREYYN